MTEERAPYKTGFQKAVKGQGKLRLAIEGPAGSGKTYSALAIASGIGKRVALIDTENASSTHYADKFGFDVLALTDYHPNKYVEAIKMAESEGYDVIVVDSLTHAWSSETGAIALKDNVARRTGNDYTAWRDVSPLWDKLITAIVGCKSHIICTMRSKMEYAMDKDDKGKTTVRKVGMAPVVRQGVEYEFDVVGDMDIDHNFVVSKTRCDALDNKVFNRPGKEVAEILVNWLNTGEPPKPKPEPRPEPAKQPQEHPPEQEPFDLSPEPEERPGEMPTEERQQLMNQYNALYVKATAQGIKIQRVASNCPLSQLKGAIAFLEKKVGA